MITFLLIMGIWVLPLWFLFRLWYFTNKYSHGYAEFDGQSKAFSAFLVLVVSWIGFFMSAGIVGSRKEHMARTFFIPVRENSMAAKIFWFKVRIALLRLLLIKE